MQALQSGQSSVRVTVAATATHLHYPGDYSPQWRGHRDIAYRETVLDELGVTMQVVTLTTPGRTRDAGQRRSAGDDGERRSSRRRWRTRRPEFHRVAKLPTPTEGVADRVPPRHGEPACAAPMLFSTNQRVATERRALLADLRGGERHRRGHGKYTRSIQGEVDMMTGVLA